MSASAAIRKTWAGFSTLAFAFGAMIALFNFPQAGFAMNPTGQFGAHLVGFAASVAVPVAAVQVVLLARLCERMTIRHIVLLVLWLVATCSGIVAMIMPLWWFDAWLFTLAPWLVAAPIVPGAFGLGLAQWLIARPLFGARFFWITLTITGAIVGSIIGLAIAMVLQPVPLEMTWAAVTGLGITLPQGYLLSQAFDT